MEKNGGYYPCTGLDEGMVCAGTPSVRLGACVLQHALHAPAYVSIVNVRYLMRSTT